MTRSYKPIDLAKIKTYTAKRRAHRAGVNNMAQTPAAGATAAELLASFPDYLGASSLRKVISAIVEAAKHDRPVVAAFGAHVLKVGCGPILIDLIERGVIKAIAGNGACAIHDVELATLGETSEDVASTIRDGSFGMVQETMTFFDGAVELAQKESIGLGESVGQHLLSTSAPNQAQSVYAAAHRAGIPAAVLVAMGTDTIHASAGLSATALGAASMLDFRLVCDVVSDLGDGGDGVGGVWLNIGSAVILPEVFLKAVAIARNLGADLDAMTTANFDMIQHYRPRQNVVCRPTTAGHGHEVIGHHEILLPLLRQGIVEGLTAAKSTADGAQS